MHKHTCIHCSIEFESKSRARRYCTDKCRYRAKDKAKAKGTCRICQDPMWIGPGSKPDGEGAHNACLSNQHGTRGTYRRGCRCDECTNANRLRQAEFREGYKERHGVSIQSVHKQAFKDKHGYWPQRERDWISYSDRLAIYDRDGWDCYLCDQPVVMSDGTNADLAPSLDHVLARASGGTDAPENLRTAHRSCNSRKGSKALGGVA